MKADRDVVAALGALWVHDLVNLLAVADSSAALLERGLGDAEKVAKHASRVREKLRAARDLASRCLAVGRGDPIERGVEPLAELVARAWSDAGRGEGGAALDVELVPGALVFVDEPLFRSTLVNVFRNAVEAGATRLRVSVELPLGEIHVADDGAGYDPDAPPRGNGIALDASRAILRLHGGALHVTREPAGTRVVLSGEDLVRLPAP